MSPQDFDAWVAHMGRRYGLNRKGAAEALGVQPAQLTRWAAGPKGPPHYIALACAAVANGLEPWVPPAKRGAKP